MSIPLRTALRLWPAILGMLIVIAINRIEHLAMPVVTGFTITEMQHEGNKIQLSGYMRKDRDCVFAGVSAEAINLYGKRVSIPLVFKDNKRDSTGTRPTGTQDWGPWSLEIPIEPSISEVTLSSVHQCHVFWATTTRLITFPSIKPNNKG